MIPRVPAVLAALGLLVTTLPCPLAAQTKLLGERDFRLAKDGRDQVVFPVDEAGMLVVRVRIREPVATAPVKLLLEGPGGLRVEKRGSAPLRLRYAVTAETASDAWRVSVINTGKLPNVLGRLTVELGPQQNARRRGQVAADGTARITPAVTDGRVSIVDDQRLRAECRDRNPDVSVRLDLEQGTGALLMRFNHVFSFAVRQISEDRIEMRGSGQHPLYLDITERTLFFASGETGLFCRVRIYRRGDD